MKRRNFLRGLLGTGAVVVSAPVIAKVMPVEDGIDRIHRLGDELDDLNAKPNMMKVSGDPLSTGGVFSENLGIAGEDLYAGDFICRDGSLKLYRDKGDYRRVTGICLKSCKSGDIVSYSLVEEDKSKK